jgi:hypothetical protein
MLNYQIQTIFSSILTIHVNGTIGEELDAFIGMLRIAVVGAFDIGMIMYRLDIELTGLALIGKSCQYFILQY